MSPRRVALLAPRALPWHGPGGLERHVFDLTRHLLAAGVEVDLYLSTPEQAAAPFDGDDRFRLEVISGRPFLRRRFLVVVSRSAMYPLLSLRMGRAVARSATRRRYDAVIAQGGTGFGFAWWRKQLGLDVPLVVNPHGMEESITPNVWKRALYLPLRLAIRYGAQAADRVIATDEALVRVVERIQRVPRERIVTLPNALETEAVRRTASPETARQAWSEWGLSRSLPRIVSIGRLVPNKGFAVAVEALAIVAAELPSAWSWTLIGDGPLRAELEERARAAGIAAHVRFAGRLDDPTLHSLLAETDLFLHPTLYEGSSIVTLEAMAHARPIVATRAGGIADKIIDGVTGWLVAPGDVTALANGIRRWHAAGHLERRRLGDAALERCRDHFDWRAVSARYIALIDELAHDTPPRPEPAMS